MDHVISHIIINDKFVFKSKYRKEIVFVLYHCTIVPFAFLIFVPCRRK